MESANNDTDTIVTLLDKKLSSKTQNDAPGANERGHQNSRPSLSRSAAWTLSGHVGH